MHNNNLRQLNSDYIGTTELLELFNEGLCNYCINTYETTHAFSSGNKKTDLTTLFPS